MDLKELPDKNFIRHPWEKSRLNFFIQVIHRNIPNFNQPMNILDVGAGDGFFAKSIFETFPDSTQMTCWDLNYNDEQLGKSNGTICYTRERPKKKFDLVFLMDVIEHIEKEEDFVKDLVTNSLNPGAFVLVSVPAWQKLYTTHDRRFGHYRRYSPVQCLGVLEKAGLSIEKSGGLFHSLLLPRTIQKGKEVFIQNVLKKEVVETELPDLGNWSHGRFFTGIIDLALLIDNKCSYFFSEVKIQSPGLSFWVVAKNS